MAFVASLLSQLARLIAPGAAGSVRSTWQPSPRARAIPHMLPMQSQAQGRKSNLRSSGQTRRPGCILCGSEEQPLCGALRAQTVASRKHLHGSRAPGGNRWAIACLSIVWQSVCPSALPGILQLSRGREQGADSCAELGCEPMKPRLWESRLKELGPPCPTPYSLCEEIKVERQSQP